MSHSSQKIRELFAAARELSPAQRQSWLEAECDDLQVRAEVQELLRFDIDDPFLEKPLVEPLDSTEDHQSKPIDTRTNLLLAERYRLLQKIGEGGFGVVYMAEQLQPVRRRVAVKLLRASVDSPNALARFESERQALALMDHPNIARVFDGGVATDGTPYFVMELVSGATITDYCDTNRLTNAQRMELIRTVCSAVQHAHHKGIIHRDLKPSNILVSQLDGMPIPKVIDFGIAKAIHGPLTDKTVFTAFQQMIGTPEYMSPEQAETSIVDVDTRSDIYSLGVLIYELLTGTTPFDGRSLRKLRLVDIQRTLREIEPPKPSDRLGTPSEQVTIAANRRGVSRAHMIKTIRGDLDWIVMKAIEKDRQRRYSSAQALADDLGRWLNQEPIEARPPGVLYLSTKFVRRNRAKLMLTMVALLGMFASAIGFGYGWSERNASIIRQANATERAMQWQKLADLEADRNASLRYGNAMIAAGESLRSGRRQTTLELLAECPDNKRGIEWQWLNYLAADHALVLQAVSAKSEQRAVAYIDAQHKLVSAGTDGMVRLWNTDTCQEMQSWRAADEPIVLLQCSSRGQLLIGTASGQISIRDLHNGQILSTATQKIEACVAAIYESPNAPHPDAQSLYAVGTKDGAILLWQGTCAHEPKRLLSQDKPFRGEVQTLAFSADGKQLLAAGKAGVVLFDSVTGETLQTFGDYWQTYGAMFANNLNQILMYGPSVVSVDARTFKQLATYEVPSTGILSASYVSRDKSVVFATEDQCLRRLNLTNSSQETLGYFHSGAISRLAVAADGHSLATIDQWGTLRTLAENSYACPKSIQAFDCEVASLAAHSPEAVYALSAQGDLVVWNSQTSGELQRHATHKDQGFSLALNSTHSKLVTNGLDQRLRVWSTEHLGELASYDLALEARGVAFHPDGIHVAGPFPKDLSTVAATDFNNESALQAKLALWNLDTGLVERGFGPLGNWSMKLSFSHRGSMLAAATVSDGAVVWRLADVQPVRLLSPNASQVDQVAFSLDDKYLLAAYRNGQVVVWDIALQSVVRKMVCHGDQLSSLVMNKDGTRMLTSSISGSIIRVWDWQSGQKVAELDSGLSGISDLVLTDDQQCLLVGGKDGRIVLLRLGNASK